MEILKRGTNIVKWHKDDVKKYVEAKEYIDTLVIPTLQLQIEDETTIERDAFTAEIATIYANEIEKELSGRIFVTPFYSYLKQKDLTKEAERINEWIEHFKSQPFQHTFILTFDNAWKKVERALNGELLWLPSVKPIDLKTTEASSLLTSQIEHISELIRSFW